MGIFDLLRSSRSVPLGNAEEAMGKPTPLETQNLPHHVEQCALRWSLLYRQNVEMNKTLDMMKLVLFILAALAFIQVGSSEAGGVFFDLLRTK